MFQFHINFVLTFNHFVSESNISEPYNVLHFGSSSRLSCSVYDKIIEEERFDYNNYAVVAFIQIVVMSGALELHS